MQGYPLCNTQSQLIWIISVRFDDIQNNLLGIDASKLRMNGLLVFEQNATHINYRLATIDW